jgi:hypothetical protein
MTCSYRNSDLTGYPAAVVDDPGVYRHGRYHYRTSIDGLWGDYPANVQGGSTKRKRQGRRGRHRGMSRRRARSHKPHKPKKSSPVHVHPEPSIPGVNALGSATVAYPTATQPTGGAMPIEELDPLREVGLTVVLAELVGQGRVTLGHTLSAWQREQDRVTNRTWRRPGGLVRPAGL